MVDRYDLKHIDKDRVVSLTDAIFAIAMTVLVLTLDPPPLPPNPTETQIWNGIVHILPNFVAFFASFVILGMYWIGHHATFRFIDKVDRTLVWLNIYFLLFVSMVPYTTDLYAGDEDSRIANTIFGSNLILVGLLAYAIWVYAGMRERVDSNLPQHVRQYITRRLLTGPFLAAVGLLASLVQPVYAEYIFFLMVPTYMFSGRIGESVFGDPPPNNSPDSSS